MSGRYSHIGTRYSKLPSKDDKIKPAEGLLGSIAKFAQDLGKETYGQANQLAQGFTSEATLHAPEVLAKFGGPSMNMMTEPKSTAQGIARGVGRVGGFALGLPEKIGAKVATGIANPLLRGMARGSSSMASFTPSNLATGDSSLGEKALKIRT